MTMPPTQAAAYQQLVKEGRLKGIQAEVYWFLGSTGPATRNELDSALGEGKPNAPYSRRLSEMERRGLVRRGPVRECRITEHSCETWETIPDASPIDEPAAVAAAPTAAAGTSPMSSLSAMATPCRRASRSTASC